MRPRACHLCTAPSADIERMSQAGRFFCNGCGFVYSLNESGIVVQAEPTTRSRTAPRSAFVASLSAYLTPPLNPLRVLPPD